MAGSRGSWPVLPGGYRVVSVERMEMSGTAQVLVTIDSRQRISACPTCGRRARHVHSRYTRTLRDIAVQGQPLTLRVRIHRFRCRNRRCPLRIFCERLPDLAETYARQTTRLKHKLERAGAALGGRPAARFLEHEGQRVGCQTLLRSVRKLPCPEGKTPRCLDVDDRAIRKGQRYGTIPVDLVKHRPVDLLPDRTAQSLAEWLRSHPGVEIISRDRAGAYAEGARIGAPDALQVADRWHLAMNRADALERLLNHHRSVLQEALDAAIASRAHDENAESVEIPPPIPPSTGPPLPPGAALKLKRLEEEKRIRRDWRYGRYEQVKAYHRAGMSIVQIANTMHLDRQTVSKFVKDDAFPERKQHVPRGSVLDAFRSEIETRWNSGCHNAARIRQELQANGYTGGYTIVKDYLHSLRWSGALSSARVPMAQAAGEPDRCSPRRTAAIVLKKPKDRSVWERELLEEIDQWCDSFRCFHDLADRFLSLMQAPKDKRCAARFVEWLEKATHSTVPEMRRLANGLEQDRAAVEAAMALPWSNGPVEGAVGRLKAIQRPMYNRANFDLLRRRVLGPA